MNLLYVSYYDWVHADVCLIFLFKQKTAYEMRISDWSSDVCSSDLSPRLGPRTRRMPGLFRARGRETHLSDRLADRHRRPRRRNIGRRAAGGALRDRGATPPMGDPAARRGSERTEQLYRQPAGGPEIGRAHV